MILVAHFVLPRPKAAAGEDVLVAKVRESFSEDIIPLHTWRRVSMIEATDIRADDLVSWLKQTGVDEPLNTVLEQGVLVDGLVRGLGNLKHQGPVRPRPWL